MAKIVFLHQHPEFSRHLRRVSQQLDIRPEMVEKDYWIMHCLYCLQLAGYDFRMKGGTTLSKGRGIIFRFSEDIDVHMTPPLSLELGTGNDHLTAANCKRRREYLDVLAAEIQIDGVKVSRDMYFDDKPLYRHGGIRLDYRTKFGFRSEALQQGVLLEVGFEGAAPNEPLTISSWVYDSACAAGLNIIDNRAVDVLCYLPEYTLADKLNAITNKYLKYKETGKLPGFYMRHYYDVYCLLKVEEVLAFTHTQEFISYRKQIASHISHDIPCAKNEALLLSNPDDLATFTTEYKLKESMYYQGQPDFEQVIAAIRKWASEH